MRLKIFSVLLLLGLASSAPTSKNNQKLIITKDFFIDSLKIYEAQHDIVKICVPMNNINFNEDSDSESEEDESSPILFFVEADEIDGQRVDKGLYILKKRKAKKLLENGRDIAAPHDDSKIAFFAAKDGIYFYNNDENKAEKYGNVDDELVGIVATNTSDVLYVLTANKEVYKVTEDGTKKVKIDEIKNAEQIATDFSNNLFYADTANNIFAVTENGVKKIQGLPEDSSKVTLIRPPFLLDEGVVVVADKDTYTVYPNGTSKIENIETEPTITAYSIEISIIQYYAINKKIYEFNILALMLNELINELKQFLDDKQDSIRAIATRSRSDFVAKTKA